MVYPHPDKNLHPLNPNYTSSAPEFAPSEPGHPPQDTGYPPPGPVYPHQGSGFPPAAPGYGPPPQPPSDGYYPPSGPGYFHPGSGYLPQGPGYGPPPLGPAITTQPTAQGGWMIMPQASANCPAGLEYLSMIDQLLVHQKVELLEAFTGFETKNKFTIKNTLGQKVYYAAEKSDCLTRNCCGSARPFDMKIVDNYGNEVIHLRRPFACSSCCCPCCPCCCPCCLESMEVCAPPGIVVGTIEEDCSICTPQFSIKNSNGDTVLRIEGPICKTNICGDVKFRILSADGETKVGKISKQWSGLARELFTDADHFGITFPMNLDVRMKAVMLGACFLIDIMYFEKSTDNDRGTCGDCFADIL